MKKVELMKLNLQQENILSKEEKKILLGGYGNSCYVTRNGSEIAVGNCDKATIDYYCGSGGEHSSCYCICKS